MQKWGGDITGDWIIFPVTIPTSFVKFVLFPNRVLMSIRIVCHGIHQILMELQQENYIF